MGRLRSCRCPSPHPAAAARPQLRRLYKELSAREVHIQRLEARVGLLTDAALAQGEAAGAGARVPLRGPLEAGGGGASPPPRVGPAAARPLSAGAARRGSPAGREQRSPPRGVRRSAGALRAPGAE